MKRHRRHGNVRQGIPKAAKAKRGKRATLNNADQQQSLIRFLRRCVAMLPAVACLPACLASMEGGGRAGVKRASPPPSLSCFFLFCVIRLLLLCRLASLTQPGSHVCLPHVLEVGCGENASAVICGRVASVSLVVSISVGLYERCVPLPRLAFVWDQSSLVLYFKLSYNTY